MPTFVTLADTGGNKNSPNGALPSWILLGASQTGRSHRPVEHGQLGLGPGEDTERQFQRCRMRCRVHRAILRRHDDLQLGNILFLHFNDFSANIIHI
jgi:hypothetical protein